MNIHEYQAKELFLRYGIATPKFWVVSSISEAEAILEEEEKVVVKVQVHAGGRGKAGGVKLAGNKQEALSLVGQMLHKKIVNDQTGPEGVIAHKVMLTSAVEIAKEYYVSITVDRKNGKSVMLLSPEGGVEIEAIAKEFPDKILTIPLTYDGRLRDYHLVKVCAFMGWKKETAKSAKQLLRKLAKLFVETDASLIEVNPLVLSKKGELMALDAKIGVDENALFRQPEIAQMFDPTQLPPNEVQAKEQGLSYVALEGDIGCMVNGAGLAMATMDLIQHYGGKPANFLDVGGSASEEKVAEGFKIILGEKGVRAILVNIFGGIMNCATIASGLIRAVQSVGVAVPVVVRMEGNNVELGKKHLEEANLQIILADDLAEAAEKVVEAAR